MSQSRDIKAGGATVFIGADLKGLIGGLNKGSKLLKDFGRGVSSAGMNLGKAGLGITAPILAAAKAFQMAGDQVQDMSQRTGVSAKALSELGYAAGLSGASLEDVEAGFKAMAKSEAAYMKGTPEEKFLAIADAIAKIPDPMQQAAVAMKFFGKSGTRLLPMIKSGAAGIAELRKEANDFGASISNSDAAMAGEFGDSLDRLGLAMRGGVLKVGAAVAPLLTGIANSLSSIVASTSRWIDENRGVVVTALAIGAGITVAAGALATFGFIAIGVGAAMGAIAATLSLLTSPLALSVGLAVGLGSYLLYASGAMNKLGEAGGAVFSYLHDAWAAFINAVGQGGLSEAWSVVTTGMIATWETVTSYLQAGFKVASLGVGSMMIGASFSIQEAWIDVIDAITKKWIELETQVKLGIAVARGASAGELARIGAAGGSDMAGVDSASKQSKAALSDAKAFVQGRLSSAIAGAVADGISKPGIANSNFQAAIAAASQFRAGGGVIDNLMAGLGVSASASGSSESVGTFSSAALGQLGAGSLEGKIADSTQRTAQATEGILRAVQQDGFGGLALE